MIIFALANKNNKPIKTEKEMKKNKKETKTEKKAEELKGIDLQIHEAELSEKEALNIYKNSPNRESFKVVSEKMAIVKALKEQKAKEEGTWNPTSYMPWRTEVKSRLYIPIIKSIAKKLKIEIISQSTGKLILKGKKDCQICAELQDMGLTPDEDYEFRTWQMSISSAQEYYKRENENILKAEEKKAHSLTAKGIQNGSEKFHQIFEYQGCYGETKELAVEL